MRIICFVVQNNSCVFNQFCLYKRRREVILCDCIPFIIDISSRTDFMTVDIDIDASLYFIFESLLKESDLCKILLVKFVFSRIVPEAAKAIKLCINLRNVKTETIDKRGNRMVEQLALERREVDNAMAWFSTLGGAFSALGDYTEHCAIMAGKISQQQFRLALRLNDPYLLARCRLYMALSLIQQKKFRLAKLIIITQYDFAKRTNYDEKLIAMCHGIWAKWRYDRQKYKSKKIALFLK